MVCVVCAVFVSFVSVSVIRSDGQKGGSYRDACSHCQESQTQHTTPESDDKLGTMDRGGGSRMLGFLKYRADPAKNQKGEGLGKAKLGLSTFLALSPTEKASFLHTYEQKGKNLKWVHEFVESSGASSSSAMVPVSNMYNRTVVLAFLFVIVSRSGRGQS